MDCTCGSTMSILVNDQIWYKLLKARYANLTVAALSSKYVETEKNHLLWWRSLMSLIVTYLTRDSCLIIYITFTFNNVNNVFCMWV